MHFAQTVMHVDVAIVFAIVLTRTATSFDFSQDCPLSFKFRLTPPIILHLQNYRDADEIRPTTVATVSAIRCRWSSVSKIRCLPNFSLRTAFSVRRDSMTCCCCRLTQLARMISIICHGCRMNFIYIPDWTNPSRS